MAELELMGDMQHLLLVDDERSIREPLAQYLVRNGFRVTAVENAAEARLRLNANAIDLVILDDDVEAVFHLGQQVGDRLAVEFGQMAEQAAIGRQVGGAFVRQAEYVAQDCAQGLVDLAAGGPGRVRRR